MPDSFSFRFNAEPEEKTEEKPKKLELQEFLQRIHELYNQEETP